MKIPKTYFIGQRSLGDPTLDPAAIEAAGMRVFIIPHAAHGMMDDQPPGRVR